MTSVPSSDASLPYSEADIDECLERFELAWQAHAPPDIERFLPADEGDPQLARFRHETLIELVKIDLEYRWKLASAAGPGAQARPESAATAMNAPEEVEAPATQQGNSPPLPDRPLLEKYAQRFPELRPLDCLPVDLIAEEYRVRRRWGDEPTRDEYRARFTGHGTILEQALLQVDAESIGRPRSDTTVAVDTDVVLARSSVAPSRRTVAPGQAAPAVALGKPRLPTELPQRIGRYAVRGWLGDGGFGTVYLGFDEQLERPVAIKVPRPDRFRTRQDVEAFFREARLAAQLRHPALVDVYDVGHDPSGCYIVMQFIDGHPLHQVLKRSRVSPRQAAEWIAKVAEAVHCAHKVGLVHGDLKPANILIDREQQPHVADFGLVICEQDQSVQAGQVSGTPAYMAPEQVRGEKHRLDGRADLWALGVMFYEMLTGRRPFSGPSVHDLFDEILHREPKPPRQIDDGIPMDMEWICLKCLAKGVGDRYTTGMDLLLDLQHAIEELEPDPQPGHMPGRQSTRAPGRGSVDRPWDLRSSSMRSISSQTSRTVRPTNFPAIASSFVGRDREVADLSALLHADNRMVTIVGPGGIGKTRVALRVGEELLQQMAGGCWFADLREATSVAGVAHAVAGALGVPLTSNEPSEEVVANILEYRKPLLLILDNFEQAVEHAEATLGQWRARAPQVWFLVTSRAGLGLAGEREYELGPMPVPPLDARPVPGELEAFDSVRLFCDRAQELQPEFRLDTGNAPFVAAICAGLEGIPLAVELAAARIKILSPNQIAQKLGQKFQLLQSTRRDLAPRQQTLWNTIDWSYELLNEGEKQAFLQACVFRGGFFLDAAESVLDLSRFPGGGMTLDVIQSLRDKSLLTLDQTKYEPRFGMYLSIRDYGEQKWRDSAAAEQQASLCRRFAQHYIARGEDWNGRIHSAQGAEALARLRLETENLFAVQDWALAAAEPELAARAILALARVMAIRGPAAQRAPRLERSLEVVDAAHAVLRVDLLVATSEARQAQGDWDRALVLADQAVALARAAAPGRPLASALRQQGEMHRQRGDVESALACFSESEALFRGLRDPAGTARALASRGFLVWQRGDADTALACYAEAERLARDLGDLVSCAGIARSRGHVVRQRGDNHHALRCYAEAEAVSRELGDERTLCLAVGNRGIVLSELADYDGARECYERAEALARKLGDKRSIAINVGNRGILLADRGEPLAAIACYAEAEAINRALGARFGMAVNLGNRANALADLEDFEAALFCFAEAEAINQQTENKFLLALNVGDRAAVWLRQGRVDEARSGLRDALGMLRDVGARQSVEAFGYLALLAGIEQSRGQTADARVLADEAQALADQLSLSERHPKLRLREYLATVRAIRAIA
jgi:serine/threonine protein kinase/predicted ATPase